jgi:hypothetical protein
VGSSGHTFVAHTKALSPRQQSKDGGYGLPPHPMAIRSGQRFWPRRGRQRRTFVVRSVRRGQVLGVRVEGSADAVTVPLARLLAVRADGQGAYYQFQGYQPRKYATLAQVCELEDNLVILCVPEWHPHRPVRLVARLIPEEARHPGAWVALRCDLSVPTAGRLQPSDIRAVTAPDPADVDRPELRPPPHLDPVSVRLAEGR